MDQEWLGDDFIFVPNFVPNFVGKITVYFHALNLVFLFARNRGLGFSCRVSWDFRGSAGTKLLR